MTVYVSGNRSPHAFFWRMTKIAPALFASLSCVFEYSFTILTLDANEARLVDDERITL
jgi:hypothetical protein